MNKTIILYDIYDNNHDLILPDYRFTKILVGSKKHYTLI